MNFQQLKERKTMWTVKWQVVHFFLFCWCYQSVSSQLRYSIPEEVKKGFLVGNIAKDLNLNIMELAFRQFRIVSESAQNFFNVNLENGNLYVSHRIDRETICEMTTICLLSLEAVAENPLNVFHVEVEIQDINDNPPIFSKSIINLEISEYTQPGTRYALGNAHDPDMGTNSLQAYTISENYYFKLGEKTSVDGIKYPDIILEKPLDREKQSAIEIILTALDGGQPVKTGTATINIIVSDINDNTPVFQKELYQINMVENAPINSLVIALNATDEDEGLNGQITYSFGNIQKNAQQIFNLDTLTGEIKTKSQLDFEMTKAYEMIVLAEDGGGLASRCKIVVRIVDANDNAPEIILTSVTNPIPEDSLPGTVIALINIRDMDSGENGDISCRILDSLPFNVISSSRNYYRLVSTSTLDREQMSEFNITIKATDKGTPPLSTLKTIRLEISDVNDNPPVFEESSYILFIQENKLPGSLIYGVQATDVDLGDNAKIVYSIVNKNKNDIPVSSYISINAMTGDLYAQRQFDYEQLREFEIKVTAKDNGSPPQESNVTVKICIIDQNDNAPKILYPSTEVDNSALFEIVPPSSDQGYLVTKVVAVDADSGHNGWLSYHFLQVPEPSYFSIGQYSGEIRTSHAFKDSDKMRHKVIVMVKDNGSPPLSSTATLNLVVTENVQQEITEIQTQSQESDSQSNLNIYLVVALVLISFLFILTVMLAVISKCRKSNYPKTFGTLPTDMYSQVGYRYPTNFNNATLTLPYSYDVCVALDSTQNEFAFLKPAKSVPTDNLIDADDSGIGNNSLNDSSPSDITAQVRHLM